MPTIPLFNTDPNIQAQAALIQQRQALAQTLMEQGLKPLDVNNRQIGGVAYHVSPFEGLAKILQGYAGQKGVQDSISDQANLAAQAYANLLDKYQTSQAQYSPEQITAAEGQSVGGDGYGPPDPTQMARVLMSQDPGMHPLNPNNPMNIPAQILANHDAGIIGDKQFETLTAPYAPTDASKAAIQGGFSPTAANQTTFQKGVTDPKIWAMQQAGFTPRQIYLANLGEAAKAGDIERRPGQQFQNPLLGQSGVVGKIPDASNVVGTPAPNGAVSVAPMPGATPVIQNNAQAGSTGSANGSIIPVTTSAGATIPMRGSAAVGAGTAAPAPTPVVGAPGSAAPATVKPAPVRLGQTTADKAVQEESGKNFAALPQQVQQTKQTITGLENALAQIEQLKTSGPGVSKTVNALAILNNAKIPLLPGDVNGYQTLKKYIENSAASAAAAGGFTGSDARFEQFKAGQPNAETMNAPALENALRYVLSQQDAVLNRGRYIMRQSGNDATKYQQSQQAWSSQYNPRYFEVQRMAPKDQAAAVNAMSPSEAAAYRAWRNAQKGG